MKNLLICIIFGCVGFIFYFIYDINSIKWENKLIHKGFFAGTVLVTFSVIPVLTEAVKQNLTVHNSAFGICIFSAKTVLFVLFFVLLIYTLFFAIPFNDTYLEQKQQENAKIYNKNKKTACMTGMYALCRHPGVLWLSAMMLMIWWMNPIPVHGCYYVLMILLDVLYVVFQDIWTFPKTFYNYEEYKQSVPFLLPTAKSVKKCVTDLNKR